MSQDTIPLTSADTEMLTRLREELRSAQAQLGQLREQYLSDEHLLLDEISRLKESYRQAVYILGAQYARTGDMVGEYDYRPDIGAFVRQPGRTE